MQTAATSRSQNIMTHSPNTPNSISWLSFWHFPHIDTVWTTFASARNRITNPTMLKALAYEYQLRSAHTALKPPYTVRSRSLINIH